MSINSSGCQVARVIWCTVGSVFGTGLCPNNLQDGAKFYTFGFVAVCWAKWNCRNRATFEYKLPKSPFDMVFFACVFLNYWAGLQKNEDRGAIERARMLSDNAATIMRICAATDDATAN